MAKIHGNNIMELFSFSTMPKRNWLSIYIFTALKVNFKQIYISSHEAKFSLMHIIFKRFTLSVKIETTMKINRLMCV